MIESNIFLDLNKFEIQSLVGQGSFSKVYKVLEKSTGKIYAAKISKSRLEDFETELITNLRREVSIMSRLNHPSIITFIGFSPINFKHKAKPVIITEFSINGTLNDIIELERQNKSPKSWDNTKKLINIFGIASAMSYLHSKNIIHRDLKPDNILESEDFYPKIADFGFSKQKHINSESIQQSVQSIQCIKGTPAFIAPEGFENYEYIEAGDVYAFAIIVYELMTLEKAFSNINFFLLIQKVANNYRPQFNKPIPKCYKDLITKCWSNNPDDRPTFHQIVEELKNNSEFLIDGVDKEKFHEYVDMISSFNINIDNNDEKHKKQEESIERPSSLLNKLDEVSSPILIELKKKKSYSNLPQQTQLFFNQAQYDQNQKSQIMRIKSKEVNRICLNRSYKTHDFIKTLKSFEEIFIEFDSDNPLYDQAFKCISKWQTQNIKINMVIANVESVINFLRKEKNHVNIILKPPINSLEIGSFSECSSIIKICIPSTLKEIAAYSFSECSSLEEILIPSSVLDIGAFRMCTSLKEITIPCFVKKIKDSVFYKCTSLAKISLPLFIDEIGPNAFCDCSSLKQIIIPSSVKEIDRNTFCGCINSIICYFN